MKLERETSLELATSTLARLRSTNWAIPAYSDAWFNGAGNESRTRDLNLGKVALYQLSYSRIWMHLKLNWSGKRVSNSRPQPWQGCALPTELFPHIEKEQSTSNQDGAGNESRTRDLNLGKVALYQLSYSRSDICCFVYRRRRNYYGFNRVRQVFCFYFFKNFIWILSMPFSGSSTWTRWSIQML